MGRTNTDKPSVDYTPKLDIAELDWAQGTQRIYYQTTRVKLSRHEDGTFAMQWRDRKTKPKEFTANSIYDAQLQKLANTLGDHAQGRKAAEAFNERLQNLSAAEVNVCLHQIAQWYTNSVNLSELTPRVRA